MIRAVLHDLLLNLDRTKRWYDGLTMFVGCLSAFAVVAVVIIAFIAVLEWAHERGWPLVLLIAVPLAVAVGLSIRDSVQRVKAARRDG